MENAKAPTAAAIAADVKWTREYIAAIRDAKRAGDYVTAANYCMEISAIWATIAGQFDDAADNRAERAARAAVYSREYVDMMAATDTPDN